MKWDVGRFVLEIKMGIEQQETLLHWNYFLAIENDLEKVSRYIEFTQDNFDVYSIELAHLLLTSASEVDVVAKGICRFLVDNNRAQSINGYRTTITQHLPEFIQEEVYVPRYNLTLRPWSNWINDENQNPLWWRSYNNVKHQRQAHFRDANLKNTLNAVAGLLVSVFYFYRLKFISEHKPIQNNSDVNQILKPEPSFLRLRDEYYYEHILFG
jgi:hypothetical protein